MENQGKVNIRQKLSLERVSRVSSEWQASKVGERRGLSPQPPPHPFSLAQICCLFSNQASKFGNSRGDYCLACLALYARCAYGSNVQGLKKKEKKLNKWIKKRLWVDLTDFKGWSSMSRPRFPIVSYFPEDHLIAVVRLVPSVFQWKTVCSLGEAGLLT